MLSPKRFFRGSALALVGLLILALLVVQYSEENNEQDRGRSYTEDDQEEESGTNRSSSEARSLPSDGGSSSPLSSDELIETNDLLPKLRLVRKYLINPMTNCLVKLKRKNLVGILIYISK